MTPVCTSASHKMSCWSRSWTLLWGPAGSLLSWTQHWQPADRQSQWLFPHRSPCTLGLQGPCTLPGSGSFTVPAPCISSCHAWAAAESATRSAPVLFCTSSCCLPALPSPFVFCPSLGQTCQVGLCPRELSLLLPGRSTDPTHYHIPGCCRQPQLHILPTASPALLWWGGLGRERCRHLTALRPVLFWRQQLHRPTAVSLCSNATTASLQRCLFLCWATYCPHRLGLPCERLVWGDCPQGRVRSPMPQQVLRIFWGGTEAAAPCTPL